MVSSTTSHLPSSDTTVINSDEEVVGEVNDPARPASFTLGQWILVIVLGTINVFSAMVYSIQAPFYPAEAESKNCTATEYGLVFGSYELTAFIMCPVIGTCMYRFGTRTSYHFGLILAGISVVLFGFLPNLQDHLSFLIASFALRILEAVGASIVFIATSTIVTMQFPDSIATIFATLELTFGLGFSVGPTVGSLFFQLQGFMLPFVVLGGTLLGLSVITFCILSTIKFPTDNYDYQDTLDESHSHSCSSYTNNNNSSTVNQQRLSSSTSNNGTLYRSRTISTSSAASIIPTTPSYAFLDLCKIPSINLYSFSNFVCAMAVGFLTATLEPHIRKYKLHKLMTGIMFFLYGGVYAITAPFFGKICDKIKQPVFVTLIGSILIFIGFLLIGPAPFFPVLPLLSLTIAGLITFGLGLGGVYVSTFLLTLQDAKANGFPDTSTTSSLVSALWMSCISLGCFVGPSIAGLLVDHFGFRYASIFILTMESIVILLLVIHITVKNKIFHCTRQRNVSNCLHNNSNNESSSLLANGR